MKWITCQWHTKKSTYWESSTSVEVITNSSHVLRSNNLFKWCYFGDHLFYFTEEQLVVKTCNQFAAPTLQAQALLLTCPNREWIVVQTDSQGVVQRDSEVMVHLGLRVPSVIFEYMNIYSKEHKVQWEMTTYSKLLLHFTSSSFVVQALLVPIKNLIYLVSFSAIQIFWDTSLLIDFWSMNTHLINVK